MDLLQPILLGLLQGATEFLPISSSGHLVLAEKYFGISEASLTFDVGLHLGSVLAVLLFFRNDFIAMARSLLPANPGESGREKTMLLFICLGSVPAVLTALLFKDMVENTFRQPLLVAGTLFFFGLLLLLSEKAGSHRRDFEELALADAILIGCAQALALMPGVSRSGVTMTAALFLGLNRPAAARFSFLLSAPIILGAGLFHIPEIMQQGLPEAPSGFYLAGFMAAAISGYFFIALLLRFIERHSLALFAYYRFLLAALVVFAMS